MAQMTVQFASRPSIFGWTVHFHPFGPSTLDQTRHTKSAVFGIIANLLIHFKFLLSLFHFFIYFNQKCKKVVPRGYFDVKIKKIDRLLLKAFKR